MNRIRFTFSILSCVLLLVGIQSANAALKVVTTSSDYASITRFIGGDHVQVSHIIRGDQDPHQVKPKPSFAEALATADMLVATGLDLEMWLPTLVDKSGNQRIREGQVGYVSVHHGMDLMDIPRSLDRSQGDVHVYGNPHFHTSPLAAKVIARNITIGLIKNDPAHEAHYRARLKSFQEELDKRLFGEELVKLLGGDTLTRLAASGNLFAFLSNKKVKGVALVERLGGWLKKAEPLRGMKLVSYHKNWTYLAHLFGLSFVAEVEARPGIPPSAKDVASLVEAMRKYDIKVIFAANYFDENKIRLICEKVGARAVIVPLSVGGAKGADDYFTLVDLWLDSLLAAVK